MILIAPFPKRKAVKLKNRNINNISNIKLDGETDRWPF